MSMKRRAFLTLSAGTAAGLIASPFLSRIGCAGADGRRPNILFINTDDQAQWAVGAYGNNEIHTPNMDRLAAEGMKFTRAFTCPVCSPSRAMVMTGLYNHQVGIDDWISPDEPFAIPLNVPTIAEELGNSGYRTGLVGKWHLGHSKPEFFPENRGFDYFAGFLKGGDASMMDPELLVNGKTEKFKGGLTDVFADHAIEFMRADSERPFILFFHPRRPHAPYVPVPDQDWEPYRGKTLTVESVDGVPDKKIRAVLEKYYASVTSVDRNLGRLLQELENLGIAEDTIVIFTGDNGYNIGQHGLHHKGNGRFFIDGVTRPNIWDTSAMVPLLVRWPGMVTPGSVCDRMVSSIDYFPTLLDISGADRRPGVVLEGMNMTPLLRGKETAWRDELYLIYNQHHYDPHANMRMIRTKEWKLVHHYEEGAGHELYDLMNDPDETTNLYGMPSVKNIQSELHRKLVLWEKRTGA